MLGTFLCTDQLALVERCLALGGAVSGQCCIADIGCRISWCKYQDIQTIFQMLDTDRVQEAADGIFG